MTTHPEHGSATSVTSSEEREGKKKTSDFDDNAIDPLIGWFKCADQSVAGKRAASFKKQAHGDR